MSETRHLEFHCVSASTHQSFLQAHSKDKLQLTEEQPIKIRVFTSEETTKLDQGDETIPPEPICKNALNISKLQTQLQTWWLRQVLIHTPTISSTQDVFKRTLANCSGKNGWIILTSEQKSGRGRHGNTWTSPEGSVAFKFALTLRMHQTDHLVFLQYLAALSIVQVAQD